MKIRVIAGRSNSNELKPLFEKYGKVTLIRETESSSSFSFGEITCIFEMSDEEGKTAIKALNGSNVPGTRERIHATNWD